MHSPEALTGEPGYRGFSFRELAAEIGIKKCQCPSSFPDQGWSGCGCRPPVRERFFEMVAPRRHESRDDVIAICRLAREHASMATINLHRGTQNVEKLTGTALDTSVRADPEAEARLWRISEVSAAARDDRFPPQSGP